MRYLEEQLQRSCVKWFDLQHRRYSPLLFHVPNGGHRNVVEARIFKGLGVRSGVADLILAVPNKHHPYLAIEMKAGKGKQSENQKAWQEAAEGIGAKYVVVNDIDLFIETVNEYLKEV